jgi:hypothetical protein
VSPDFRRVEGLPASLAAAAVLAASALFTPATLPPLQTCWFARLHGLPCPTCGMTRSFCSLAHGEWAAAWAYNPFGYVLMPMAVAALLRPAVLLAAPSLRDAERRFWASTAGRRLPVALVLALAAFGLLRIGEALLRG